MDVRWLGGGGLHTTKSSISQILFGVAFDVAPGL